MFSNSVKEEIKIVEGLKKANVDFYEEKFRKNKRKKRNI